MPTVAIVCEYNPFHNGHKYLIDTIREIFGKDTSIVAIMSGNFTQRGEIAIADKTLRAKWAVDCGINLCLELPFPFSMSSAELFAKSAVYIADRIGIIDYLVFGSESGDITELTETAAIMLSEEYQTILAELALSPENKAVGYPRLCEIALNKLKHNNLGNIEFSSNNILALEYIKALMLLKSKIIPYTIERTGAAYRETEIIDSRIQSATAIRQLVKQNEISAELYVPKSVLCSIYAAAKNGELPCDENELSSAVISSFRLNHPSSNITIYDATGGLYNRLEDASLAANTIQELVRMTETKKFTIARIRRAIWYSYFGVTSSEVTCYPEYTQVLAMDTIGKRELKKIKKGSDFPVLTKPSNTTMLSDTAKRQKLFSDRADAVFQLTKPSKPRATYSLTFTPYVKCDE